MPNTFTTAGNNVTQRIVFNTGYLDFGTNRLVAVKQVSLTLEYTLTDLMVLNSIKPADKVRSGQKITLEGKMDSYSPELEEFVLGSSTTGTPQEIDTLDGQPTYQNPVLTLFDRNGKEIQYQLSGALFKSNKLSTSAENYGEWDFTLEAKDMVEVYTA